MVNTTVSMNFSPVTLKESWSRSTRLIWLVILAIVGCIGNVFKIASIMIDDYLRKTENCMLVVISLGDLVMTSIVIPTSSIFLLSGIEPSTFVCKMQWFLTVTSFFTNSIALSMAAVENYARITGNRSSEITTRRITALLFMLVCFSIAASSGQIQLGYDFCTRKTLGNSLFQLIISIAFIFTPVCVSFTMYLLAILHVKRLYQRANFKPSTTLQSDYNLTKSNFYCFLLFFIMWSPFVVIFICSFYYSVSDEVLYVVAWIGIIESCFSPFVYCATNRHFRRSFVRLFNYCFLKTNVGYSRRQRTDARSPRDVRVHIIPGYSMYSPPRRARNSTSSA